MIEVMIWLYCIKYKRLTCKGDHIRSMIQDLQVINSILEGHSFRLNLVKKFLLIQNI